LVRATFTDMAPPDHDAKNGFEAERVSASNPQFVPWGSLFVNKEGGEEQAVKHDAFHTLVLSGAANETGVAMEAAADDTEVVLISGEPLDQEVFQYGPFGESPPLRAWTRLLNLCPVMTTRQEIQQTLRD
ncbi:10356_t:CDS:2, partial [Acaulospora colombiana]